jgi:hypothetical protein
MPQLNLYSDLSSIAQTIQDDAIFVVRETYVMPSLVTVFNDMSAANPRVGYKYNQATVGTIGEADDLTSSAFAPSADQTLTPQEIGLQFFISDKRADSSGQVPENVLVDAARELGLAAGDKIQADLLNDIANFTGGSIAGSAANISWAILTGAIAQARQANKASGVPLKAVLHGYQWAQLAKAASVAAGAVINSPNFSDEMSRQGYVGGFMGVPIIQVYPGTEVVHGTAATAWFNSGIFPSDALALDWRRPIRIRAQRDESRRGVELNMTALYAHGVWRPDRGVLLQTFATAYAGA